MNIFVLAFLIFAAGYLLNVYYVTVFYHRGLTHRAIEIGPKLEKWIAVTGPWLTGIDPKGWVCMHRLHHRYSDTAKDPHSPVFKGVIGVAMGQLDSYKRTLRGILKRSEPFASTVSDLKFNICYLNRKRLWWLPYAIHFTLGIAIGALSQHPILGIAYFLGIMTHPIQGWMVNALAHKYGYRNFDTDDNSKNNIPVALLVVGEGYQNNHHAFPKRANFGIKPWEVDFGYLLVLLSAKLGILKCIPKTQ